MGMDPATMMIAGSALSAGSSIMGGMRADAAGRANAAMLEDQAELQRKQGVSKAEGVARSFDKFRGALRGDIAAHGGSSASGTGLLLAKEAARQAKLDELNLLTEGVNSARSSRGQAEVTRYEARTVRNQKIMGGLGKAMSGWGRHQGMVS